MQDSFVADRLPPRSAWPEMHVDVPDGAALNCGVVLLDEAVARWGDRPVLHYAAGASGRTTWTYADLLDRSNRIAEVLVDDLGLVSGNRVMLRAPNTPMMVAAWFAVVRAGGIVVATMPMLRSKELAEYAVHAEIDHGLCDATLVEDWEVARRSCGRPTVSWTFTALGEGDEPLDVAMRGKTGRFEPVATRADDPMLLAYTSGTTGRPKATVHFHRDMVAICDAFPGHVLPIASDDVFVGSPPLAFTFGLGALAAFPMRYGASSVMLDRFTPAGMLEQVRRFGCTGIYTSPTGYRALLAELEGQDVGDVLRTVRTCVSAGETLPAATWEAWKQRTGISIIDGIGSTEMLHIFISAGPDEARAGFTGRVVPGYEARIVDERGREVAFGDDGTRRGRLAVRGPTGCRYLADPENQAKYVVDGWNLTGDVYEETRDGWFRYVARADDMIICSGYNLSGPEIESVLLAHDAVAECAVVGAPDEHRGQVPVAFVVVREGALREGASAASEHAALERALQDYAKAHMAPYKYPRRVLFRSSLPRTGTGKIQRFSLRAELLAGSDS